MRLAYAMATALKKSPMVGLEVRLEFAPGLLQVVATAVLMRRSVFNTQTCATSATHKRAYGWGDSHKRVSHSVAVARTQTCASPLDPGGIVQRARWRAHEVIE